MPSPRTLRRSARFAFPTEPFRTATGDGVSLVGARIGGSDRAVILCHGFGGWHGKPRYARLADALTRGFTVYVFDFRGHGASGGISTFGALEINDITAMVELARNDGHDHVATLGASMGGIAVVRHAALVGGVDAVVAVSTPSRWDGHDTDAVRKMVWLTASRSGRRLLRAWGTRVIDEWAAAEDPESLVGRIAPTPLVIVHGRADH